MQDELESIFHVLVYYSVRFVDSNIDYVDNFICDYFDAHLQYLDGERCGSLKRESILDGFIHVSWYNNARLGKLEFYAPNSSDSSSSPTPFPLAPGLGSRTSTPRRSSTPQQQAGPPPYSPFGSPLTELVCSDDQDPDAPNDLVSAISY